MATQADRLTLRVRTEAAWLMGSSNLVHSNNKSNEKADKIANMTNLSPLGNRKYRTSSRVLRTVVDRTDRNLDIIKFNLQRHIDQEYMYFQLPQKI
jgi:hypothetical protein